MLTRCCGTKLQTDHFLQGEASAHGRWAAHFRALLWLLATLLPAASIAATELGASASAAVSVPILVYHRFGPSVADSMTVRSETFAAQLKYLRENGYTVVPLRQALNALQGKGPALPAKALAITVDDGHRTVYSELLPLIQREKIPVTLFIYPSAISNADYAMTWQQLAQLRDTGLFDIQSHTYWHPNFKIEKRRLAPDAYRNFVRNQLEKPRRTLKQRLAVDADLLAWPFGIYDDELEAAARAAGYVAAFSIDARHAHGGDKPMELPRYLMVDSQGVKGFAKLLAEGKK